jgi:hypothetical protein
VAKLHIFSGMTPLFGEKLHKKSDCNIDYELKLMTDK